MAESTIEKETGSVVKNTFYLSRERERESRTGGIIVKGGLRQSERKIGRLSDDSYGGDLRG